MAPIKFEEDMKDKLEKRTIQPSAKSWNTLSKRLDNDEKKSNKKGFWWLGIAASIIGILLVTNLFFKTNESDNKETILVEDNNTIDTLKTKAPKQLLNTQKQNIIVKTKEPTLKKSKTTLNKALDRSNYIVSNANLEKKAKDQEIKKSVITEKSTIQSKDLLDVVENKTNSIEIENTKNLNTLDTEIDVLLANATQDITMQKNNDTIIPIDHNELLLAVEDELDETFRDKMFKVAKKGYSSLKESVAERND